MNFINILSLLSSASWPEELKRHLQGATRNESGLMDSYLKVTKAYSDEANTIHSIHECIACLRLVWICLRHFKICALVFFQIYFKYISPTFYQKYIILFSKGVKIKYIYGIYLNIFKCISSKIYFSTTLEATIWYFYVLYCNLQ